MTTALSTLRQMLIEAVQGSRYVGLVCDAGCDGTSLIDTGLLSLPGGGDDDFCLGWYGIMTTSTAGEYEETSRVSSYDASAWDITLATALTGSPSAGEKFDLCRYDPLEMHKAINRAVEQLYPFVTIPKRDETLFVDNLLLNPDGETFSTTFTSWTHTANTWSQESTRKIHGSYSFKGVASGAAAQLEQNLFTSTNIYEIAGKSIYLRGWVWASDASAARIRVSFDGSTYYSSDYHAGSSEWEGPGTMYVNQAVPTDATEMTVWLEVADGYTAYFDMLTASVNSVYKYTIPSTILKGPYVLSVQSDLNEPNGIYVPIPNWHMEEDSSGRYIILEEALSSGHCLRVDGHGVLSTMTSDAGTTEVDAPRTHLVVAKAAQLLFEQLAEDSATLDSTQYVQQAQKWAMRVQELMAQGGMRSMRRAAAHSPRWLHG